MKKSVRLGITLGIAICVTANGSADAKIIPASLFTDNAVLQQKQPVPIWGLADPGEPITVTIAGQTVATKADASGNWSIKLKAINAGGPYTLSISGTPGDAVTLNNVLVGEVWICSGQSNMFYPLTGFPNNPLTRAAIPTSTDPQLRFALVSATLATTPQTMVATKWQEANPDTVPRLTAVGYFFGRDLRKALRVPVGLIDVAVGGTPAQAWTSQETLASNPILKHHLDAFADYEAKYPDLLTAYNAKIAELRPAYDADMAKWRADADAAKLAGTSAPPRPKSPPMAPSEPAKWLGAPARLYNGMIAPLIPYGIRGAIWYQGEANWNLGDDYKTLFPALIANWRTEWKEGNFPFLFVQLPGYNSVVDTPGNSWFAEVREAQRLTLVTPNTAMAVITDLGDQKDIHPLRKEPVGDRLALAARALVYGEKVEYTGPVFDSIAMSGSTVRVKFTHAEGLHTVAITDASDTGPLLAPADKVMGFAIAGADQKFYNADAVIDGESVVCSSPSVVTPVAVRYGWAQYPLSNLVNAAGLWASPFRTDDWRWISAPRPETKK